MQQAAL